MNEPTKTIQELAAEPDIDRPVGRYGWEPADVPKGGRILFPPRRWYRSPSGIDFWIAESGRRVTGKPGYWVGSALLRDGRVQAIEWGPFCRPLTLWERFLAWVRS